MATLLDKQVRVNRTVTVTAEHARAIEDPIRSKIVSMLYGRTLSAEEITEAVNRNEPKKKALTTVRHHMDVLKTAGLIEVTRIVESRGGVTKYYGTSTRLLGFETPENFDSVYSSVIDRTAKRIEEVLNGVFSDTAESDVAKPRAEYSAYLVMEIMNRAITRVLEKGKRRRGSRKAPAPSNITTTKRAVRGRKKIGTGSPPSDNGQGSKAQGKTGNG